MDIDEIMNTIADKVSNSNTITLMCGIYTTETGMKLLCHGKGKIILTMIVCAIKQISDDTGVSAASICADIIKNLIAIEKEEKECQNGEC